MTGGRPRRAPSRATATVAAVTVAAFVLAYWAHARVDPHYYYAAAARSMSTDWHAFLYGAYDPAGSVTVDKVPGALWFQALSVRLFGFHPWSLLLPQALAFAATVPVLHSAVRRWAGETAGLVAALAFALTPVTLVLARANIPDTFLVLFLVCAARAGFLAAAAGRPRKLLVAAFWVGVAFHMKMAQAYLVLPALLGTYAVAAAGSRAARLARSAAALVVALAVSAVWPVLVALTPASERPYVDGSAHDSVWEMLVHYNGLSRFGHADPVAGHLTSFLADFGGAPAAARLFNQQLGPEISWLLPFAALSLVAGPAATRNRPRTDPERAGWLLWGGWLVVNAVCLSAATAVHPYYTAALTPAVAAVTGAGTTLALRARRAGTLRGRLWPPVAVAVSGVWAVALTVRADGRWGPVAVVTLTCLIACGSLVTTGTGAPRRWTPAVTVLTATALLAGPGIRAVTASARAFPGLTAINPVTATDGALPPAAMASLHGFPPDVRLPPDMGNMNMAVPNASLLHFIDENYRGERYHLAVPTANTASPYLRAGRSVLPMGGFTGAAQVPTLHELARLTSSGELRYVMTGGFHGGMGGPAARARGRWVAGHCAPVPPELYRTPGVPSGPPGAPETLFDCAPQEKGGRG